jgi:hypothetical protein
MYNPDNLELPDYYDPRLTDYIWEYSIGSLTHVIALDRQEWGDSITPLVFPRLLRPTHFEADFHLDLSVDVSYLPALEEDIWADYVGSAYPEYSEIASKVARLLGLGDSEVSLERWFDRGSNVGLETLIFHQWRDCRLEWTIRAWPGLKLEHLKTSFTGLEVEVAYEVDGGEENPNCAIGLETFEHSHSASGFENLRYKDAELGAKLALADYHSSPSESLALQAAGYLHKVGGPELVTFHIPELEFCRSCGEPTHFSDLGNCGSRQHAWDF